MQAMNDQQMRKLMRTLFPLIGVVLLVGTAVSVPFKIRFIDAASRAEGTMTKLRTRRAHPRIEFTPVGKSKVEFSWHGWIYYYRVGDRVPVLYLKDAESPSGYRISVNTIGSLWFDQFMGTLLGISFVFMRKSLKP